MIKSEGTQKDELTGLFTHKAFLTVFAEALSQAKAGENEKPLSLAMVDIDFFMHINEDYGHVGGDQVLVGVADVIRECSGEAALGSRYGGDEFVILFPGVEREQAFLTLEQIRQALKGREFKTAKGEVIQGIPISGGVASFPVDGRTGAELIRKADQALYRAKAGGRSQIRLAFEERMVPKTTHYTQTQLERLAKLAAEHKVSEADLLREAMDDLLTKYGVNDIES